MLSVDPDRMRRTMSLFHAGSSPDEHILSTKFESLCSQIMVRAKVMEHCQNTSSNPQSAKVLARLFEHASLRLSDVLTRLNFIDAIQKEFIEKDIKLFSPWNVWAALLIKDFHLDVISLMDSTAPIAIQGTVGLKPDDLKRLPGFADLIPDTERSYREKMPESVVRIFDSTKDWYTGVKEVRNILTHREHTKIVCGLPSDGVLFQVYQPYYSPQILDACFLWPSGDNLVDFRLYSAFIVGEALLFMEDLATKLMACMTVDSEGLPRAYRIGHFRHFLDSLNRLAKGAC